MTATDKDALIAKLVRERNDLQDRLKAATRTIAELRAQAESRQMSAKVLR